MHELSLCAAIADTAIEHSDGRAVERINLRIGHFRQVVPETLEFCWGLRNTDGPLKNCELEIDYVPAVARCGSCDAETELEAPVLICGACNGTNVRLVSGEEFLVGSIDLAPDQSPSLTQEEVH